MFLDKPNNTESNHAEVSSEPDVVLTLTPVPQSELVAQSAIPVSLQNTTWVTTLQVPWEKMHESLRRSLLQKKRPRLADRRHMVRVIADSVRQVCLNPPFKQCAELAKTIVDMYPESFEDRTEEGERLGCGYFTLSKQLRTRIEFLNRDNTFTRLRKPKQSGSSNEVENSTPTPKCAKIDSYGCVNWQPQELPEGESQDSLQEKKKELISTYSQQGQRAAEQRRVGELMELTYVQQRREINGTPSRSVSELQKEWPFLFIPKFLLQHFNKLTGIELETRLQESLPGKGRRILQFFKSQLLKWKKEVKMVLSSLEKEMEDVNPGLAAILVLMSYFKEKEETIFLLADVNMKLAI